MGAVTPGLESTPSQRWLARLSLVLAAAAIVILVVVAGLKSLAMLAVGLAAALVSLAAAYVFLSRRGLWRWLSPERPAQSPARHPYLVMNPKSGGGKVGKFDLKCKAEDLGAEVFLIGGSEPVDVAKIARGAAERGADLLGVAGGDGTQAVMAAIAAGHGIPFVVISAGARNHFAPFGAYAEIVEIPAYCADKLNTLADLLQGHRGARLRAWADSTEIEAPGRPSAEVRGELVPAAAPGRCAPSGPTD